MNVVLETIKSRRSTRKFKPEQIRQDELEAILEAGTYAPSGHNCQPWHFLVVQNQAALDAINDRTKQELAKATEKHLAERSENPRYHIFHHAPTVIIVSGDSAATSPVPLAATGASYTPLTDCSAAIQNMLLMAESLNIGSCWIGIINFFFTLPEEIAKLPVPKGYKPLFAVSLGYKDSAAAAAPRCPGTVDYLR
ncbi:MAG: nitroreductase family protein [Negativicutes bacterium]|nr:nitroreductase family protein [Negativicutes bacterium]